MRHHMRLTHKLVLLVVVTAGVSVCVPSMLVIGLSTGTIERHVADLTASEARGGVLAVRRALRQNSRRVISLSEELTRLGNDAAKREAAVRKWFDDNPDALMVGTDGKSSPAWHSVGQGGTVREPIPLIGGVAGLSPYDQVDVGMEYRGDQAAALVIAVQRKHHLPVVSKWRLDRYHRLLKDIRIGQTGYIMLVERSGLLIAHPQMARGQGNLLGLRPGQSLAHLDLVRELVGDAFGPKTSERIRYENELGSEVVAASAIIPELNWAVVAQEPEREAMADVESMKQQVLLWGSTTGLVAVLLGLAIVGQITRPLKSLSEAANRVGEGDLTHPVGVATQDEIGQLALAFNEMQIRLREMYEKLERMVAERTQETTDFLNSVLDSSTEYSIIATDLHGTILSYNEGARRIYGYEPEEIIGAPVQILIPRDPGEAEKSREILRYVRREGTYSGETDHLRKGGQRFPVRIVQTLRYDDAGLPVGYTTISRDIAQRKALEAKIVEYTENLEALVASKTQELQNANLQLERANHLKGEFLASMSHELRTPLNAIIGFADVMREELAGPLNDDQKQFVKDILESGRQLLNLINDILDLSKVEAGRMVLTPTVVELSSVFDEVQTIIQGMAVRKGLSLAFREEPLGITLQVDRLKLLQILYNLLSNAVKFTLRGGAIRVEAVWGDQDTCFRVIDTGVGIPPESLEVIFEEFRQVDSRLSREYGGTGLGLALTRKLVELHGGTITIESQVDKGSTFTFTIPHMLPADVEAGDLMTDPEQGSAL